MSTNYIKDATGRVIGRSDSSSSGTAYYDAKGRRVALYQNNVTLRCGCAGSGLYGYGDQGVAVIHEVINNGN